MANLGAVGAVLRDTKEDAEVRAAAASVLCLYGEAAHEYYWDMVKFAAEDRPDDIFGDIEWSVGGSINKTCADPFKAELIKDKALHYKVALKLARNKRQHARAEGLRMLAGMPLEDFHLVADAVMHVIDDKDPTYHSYHSPGGPVGAGLTILANLNIKEGMQLALDILDNPSGKHSFKMMACWSTLEKYGANAKPYLAKLRERDNNRTDFGRHTGKYNRMVKAIDGDENPPRELITLEEAKEIGK